MTAEAEVDGGEVASSKKGGRRRLLIIGGGALLAVAAIGAGLYFFLGVGKSQTADQAASGPVIAVPAAAQDFIFNLPEMTINLNTDGKQQDAFMKLTVALEVADQKTMTDIQPRMAKVIDAFQVYLRELRPADLDGSAGIYRLKEELLRRVNVAVAPAHVDGILFKEILVQ
ncbi:MAG TPA: flagellar basal body-associated FliL family protein [Devosia sp.]|nr:flagellar basal body-associated FliL family protein [Devosia sp.]